MTAKPPDRDRPSAPQEIDVDSPAAGGRAALWTFALALALRLLFWQATPDRTWPGCAAFQGDAQLWIESGRAQCDGTDFELGLPFRPPATRWLVAAVLAVHPTVTAVRAVWCILGATIAALCHLAIRRSFGRDLGRFVGLWMAIANGPIVLSVVPDSEVPALLLALLAILMWPRALAGTSTWAWGAMAAAGALFRAEHLVFAGCGGLALGWHWWRTAGGRAVVRRTVLAACGFAAVMAPWQIVAHQRIREFNTRAEAIRREMERKTPLAPALTWSPAARIELDAMPAFARPAMEAFVTATAVHRGARVVASTIAIEEAFGSSPKPLAENPLVALYGGLNFALAHHDRATGGFDRARLEAPPLLRGGAAGYPPLLIAGLPPPELSFVYPPHLELIRNGWSIGWNWIRANPRRYVELLGIRLRIFWSGAALGFTGFGWPLPRSSIRRAVDLVVPAPSAFATAWQVGLLFLSGWGLFRLRASPPLRPWICLLFTKLIATTLFFGYARHGAVLAPLVALGCGVVLWPAGRAARSTLAIAAVALIIECGRYLWPPEIRLDGKPLPIAESDMHRSRTYEAIWPGHPPDGGR